MLTSVASMLWLDFFQMSAQGPALEVLALLVCKALLVQTGRGEAVMWIYGQKAMASGSPFLMELFLELCFGDHEFLKGCCQK